MPGIDARMAEGGPGRQIRAVLESVERGRVDPGEALARLARLPYDDLRFARVDVHREIRQGAPEAVLAEGKEPAEVEAIVASLLAAGAGSVLVTRADAEARACRAARGPRRQEHERARLPAQSPPSGSSTGRPPAPLARICRAVSTSVASIGIGAMSVPTRSLTAVIVAKPSL